MNKCLHYNEAIKKLSLGEHYVPTSYQQVEYLQSTGTQYIDTGIKANLSSGNSFIIEGKCGFVTSGRGMLLSAYGSNSDLSIELYTNQSLIVYATSVALSKSTSVALNTLLNYVINITANSSVSVTVNGGTASTGTIPSGGRIQNSNNLILGSDQQHRYPYGMFGIMTITANSIVVRNFIPCYRKSDSVAGMYDTVSKTFFTNSGTGTFIVGPNI